MGRAATMERTAEAEAPAYTPRERAILASNAAGAALQTARDELARIKARREGVTAEHAAAEAARRQHAVAAVLGDDAARQELAGLTLTRDDAARLLEDLATAQTVAEETVAGAQIEAAERFKAYERADFLELQEQEAKAMDVWHEALAAAAGHIPAIDALHDMMQAHKGRHWDQVRSLREGAPEAIAKVFK